jgi:hypothetical protein
MANGVRYVADLPTQGAMYHRITALIAANNSGLGPNNVGYQNMYQPMIGQNFQKPISGSTAMVPVVDFHAHR